MCKKIHMGLRKCILIYVIISSLIIYTSPASAQDIGGPNESMRGFVVSENYGSVRDSYFAGNDRGIIINIQDLHCNYDAQMSIYHIINELIDKYGLNLVTVEGSVGRLETAPFSSYPDEEIKEEVAKQFLKTGKLDGAAFAHIMRKSGFTFWGVDDEKTYDANVDAYKASVDAKDANIRYYKNMSSILKKFKSKAYPAELKELDDNISAYKAGALSFAQYIAYLETAMERHGLRKDKFENFSKLAGVFKMEAGINFVEVDNERSDYMDKLSKKLDKESLSKLLDKSLYFRTGKVSALEFYRYLEGIAVNKGMPIADDYPQLAGYIEYIKEYSDIENIKLFKEIGAIEERLKAKLFTDNTQREIDRLSSNLEILKSLFSLKLTREGLARYRDERKEFLTSNFINFVSKNAPKYGIKYKLDASFRSIDRELPRLEMFYELAEKRDGILVRKTIGKMKEERAKVAVLVSGGFHTDGITKLLREKELSYVVVTPKVNSLQKDNPYRSVLLGGKNGFDKFYEKVKVNKRRKGVR